MEKSGADQSAHTERDQKHKDLFVVPVLEEGQEKGAREARACY